MKKIRTRNKIFRVNTPASFGILCAVIIALIAGIVYAVAAGVVAPAVKQAQAAQITPAPEMTQEPEITPEPQEETEVEAEDPAEEEQAPEEATPTPEPEEEKPLSGVIIAVDAGKSSTGKHKGVSSGTLEYKINLTFAEALQKELEKLGAKVVMTRTNNESVVETDERIRTVKDGNAVLLISIFCNDLDSSKTRGAEAFVAKNSSAAEESKKLAQAVLNAYTKETGMPTRYSGTDTLRLVTDRPLLRDVAIPAVGIVLGQLSNKSDDANLNDAAFAGKAATGMANGIRTYLGK